ncbi:MAG: GspE/PulE family protein [Patescibacteria group bacterium]
MSPEFLRYLVQKNILSQEQFSNLRNQADKEGKNIEDLILEQQVVSEETFFKEKSNFFKIPLVHVYESQLSPQVLEEIPEEAAKRYRMIPIGKKDSVLEIGTVDPGDLSFRAALNFIERQRRIKSKIFIISLSEYLSVLKRYKTLKKEVKKDVTRAIEELEKEAITGLGPVAEVEKKLEEEAPISKIVAVVFKHAVEGSASDIHIEPYGNEMRVRFRVDGILYSSLFLEKRILPSFVSRIKVMSNLRIDETRVPQDGRFNAEIDGRRIDFRVATFPTVQGEKVVLRVLDPKNAVRDLSQLGFRGRNLEIIQKAMALPFGSIVFCGPTGSGKSTSQYAILKGLNSEEINIVSLEDPVEYWIDGVNQSHVRPEIGYSFASGLRQVVRQDPDVIMVGEVRDKETAELVTHAALTGHLVLFTLHTNNAAGAVPRLIDLGVERFLIPPSLKVIVAQRLIRKLCPYCKKKVKANREEESIIRAEIEKLLPKEREKVKLSDPLYIFEPKGCPRCGSKGTKGRVGIFEALTMTRELEDIIVTSPFEGKITEEAVRQGMITLKQDGILKVLNGELSLEEVLKSVEIKEEHT